MTLRELLRKLDEQDLVMAVRGDEVYHTVSYIFSRRELEEIVDLT